MKASRFTGGQKAFIIKQAEDGTPIAEVCRKAGISSATFFNWDKQYDWLMPSEMKRLRELEQENARLKKINGRIEDVLKSHRFHSGEDLEQTSLRYVQLYNG